jgi:hypothetical protein
MIRTRSRPIRRRLAARHASRYLKRVIFPEQKNAATAKARGRLDLVQEDSGGREVDFPISHPEVKPFLKKQMNRLCSRTSLATVARKDVQPAGDLIRPHAEPSLERIAIQRGRICIGWHVQDRMSCTRPRDTHRTFYWGVFARKPEFAAVFLDDGPSMSRDDPQGFFPLSTGCAALQVVANVDCAACGR